MNINGSRMLLTACLAAAGVPAVADDSCSARAAAALDALQAEAVSLRSDAQRDNALLILEGLCQPPASARTVTATADGTTYSTTVLAARESETSADAQTGSEAADSGNDDERPLTILGLELKPAEKGSRGHERLKRKRP